jgi:long-chain acyl-CoA synthetase
MNRPWLEFYDQDVPHNLDLAALPQPTIPDLLRHAAENYPNQTATVFMGARITYRQLLQKVRRLASALAELGVEPGDRVAIMLPNCPQTIIAYYATLWIGGVTVLTNPLYVERELEHQWSDAGAKLVITMDVLFPKADVVCDRLGIKHLIVTGIADYFPAAKRLFAPFELRRRGRWVNVAYDHRVLAFKSLAERRRSDPPVVQIDIDDLAC